MKIGLFLASTALVFLGSACTDSSNNPEPSEPTVTVTATTSPEAAPEPSSKEDVFVTVLKDNTDSWDNSPAADIVDAAESMCTYWDSGATFEEVATVVLDAGYESYDGGFFIGAGTEAFCPEYTPKIENFVSPGA